MKNTLLKTFAAAAALILSGAAANAAVWESGYTQGSGSQLLLSNGGAGDTLFIDGAAGGGAQDIDGKAFTAAHTVLFDGSDFWNVGDTVFITGFALPVRDNVSTNGTFTFEIREASGGIGASGAGDLGLLGTRTASYITSGSGVPVGYVNFDTPVEFTVTENSTSIGINFQSDGDTFQYKALGVSGDDRLQRYNHVNGNLLNSYVRVSLAGSVIPSPVNMPFEASFGEVRFIEIEESLTSGRFSLATVHEGAEIYVNTGDTITSLPAALGGKLAFQTETDKLLLETGPPSETMLELLGSEDYHVDDRDPLAEPFEDTPFTVETWVSLPDDFDFSTQKRFIQMGSGAITIRYDASTRSFSANLQTEPWSPGGGGVWIEVEWDQALETGVWYHLAFTHDADDELRFFVNGEEVDSATTSGPGHTFPYDDFSIARWQGHQSFGEWASRIAETRIWNVARSQEELNANRFEALENPEGQAGLIGYWPMNEGEGDVLFDLSGNDQHVTVSGEQWVDRAVLPDGDLTSYLGFVVDRPTTVYIAHDVDAAVPAWISNHYTASGMQVDTTAGTFNLWERAFGAREQVSLLFDQIAWDPEDNSSWFILSEGPDAITESLDDYFVRSPLQTGVWKLNRHNWTVARTSATELDTAEMLATVGNLDPELGFKLESQIRVPRLQEAGENAIGFTLLGDGDSAIRAEWLPREEGDGSRLQLVDGSTGTVLEDSAWTGLSPSKFDNDVGLADRTNEVTFAVGSPVFTAGDMLFAETFDGGAPGWTSGSNNQTPDQWEIGEPEFGPGEAFSGSQVATTGLDGSYSTNSDSWLRTPEIDLTEVDGAVLSFQEYLSVDTDSDLNGYFHFVTVSVVDLDAVPEETTQLALYSEDIFEWTERQFNLEAFAGRRIAIEFRFVSDNAMFGDFKGWYIDDVQVTSGGESILVTSMPEKLTSDGTLYGLLTDEDGAGETSESYLQFTVDDRAATGNTGVNVYVAWDIRASGLEPDWLRNSFDRTDHFVGVSQGSGQHRLWVREYADGEEVTLGGASAAGAGPLPAGTNNYFVLFGDTRPGLETFYTLAAEGIREAGSWNIDFSLTDATGHTQMISATVGENLDGRERFGLFARHLDGNGENGAPIWEFSTLSMNSVIIVDVAGFEAWREENFPDDLDNPEISGADATPAGDGVTNLMKYALNLPPWTPVSSADLPRLDYQDGDLKLVYWERTDIDDIEYIPEVSEDLMEWLSGEPHVSQFFGPIDEQEDVREVEAIGNLPEGASKGFLRLKIRQQQ